MIRAAALALAAAGGVALAAAPAAAESLTSPADQLAVDLGDGWSATTTAFTPADRDDDADAPTQRRLAAFRHGRTGAVATLTRIDFGNRDAWRRRTRRAYFDAVENGVKKAAPGYKRLARDGGRIGRVPHLDLVFRRDGGHVVAVRFLFFRTYTLALTATGQPEHRRLVRDAARALDTYFGE